MRARERRERLDLLLVKRGLFETRERAQAAILSGQVFVNGQRATKAGARFDPEVCIEVRGRPVPYVSRGGLKLAAALDAFAVSPAGRIAIDVGASTGGFTDVLLQRGAARVVAVDVGYGQLAWKLQQDPRVTVLDRTNIRYLQPGDLPVAPSLAVIDVSFISLEKVLPAVRDLLTSDGEIIALVKPQFEAGPARVGKGGIVRDPATHREVLERVAQAASYLGYQVAGLIRSPISGSDGNTEFLIHLVRGLGKAPDIDQAIAAALNGTAAQNPALD